jgi:hypothetical protein
MIPSPTKPTFMTPPACLGEPRRSQAILAEGSENIEADGAEEAE